MHEIEREMLELAAKAHGFIDDSTSEDRTFGLHKGVDGQFYVLHADGWSEWCPADDDGDSMRLAVKLRMRLTVDDYGAAARIGDNGCWHGCEAHLYGGIEASTRRAIFRAAAAMGKTFGGSRG